MCQRQGRRMMRCRKENELGLTIISSAPGEQAVGNFVSGLLIVLDDWKTSVRRLEQKSGQVRQTLSRRYGNHRPMHDVTRLEQLQVQPNTVRICCCCVFMLLLAAFLADQWKSAAISCWERSSDSRCGGSSPPPWRLLSRQCSDQLLVTVPFLSLHRGHGTAYHLPSELFHPSPPFGNNRRHICLGSVLANLFTTFLTVIMSL